MTYRQCPANGLEYSASASLQEYERPIGQAEQEDGPDAAMTAAVALYTSGGFRPEATAQHSALWSSIMVTMLAGESPPPHPVKASTAKQ